MATVTAPRKPRNVKPSHGTVRLTVHINGTAYAVRPLPVVPGSGVVRLVRLRKAETGDAYHVHRTDDGVIECDCPSYEWDHRQRDNGPCKHGAALASVGLL